MVMSAEQKEANKRASSRRLKAYNARYREYSKAQAAALSIFDKGPEAEAFKAASRRREEALEARNAAVAAFNAKIAELTAERDAAYEAHTEGLEKLGAEVRGCWKAYYPARDKIADKVRQEYADISEVSSVSQWKPLSDFMGGEE